MRCGPRKAKFLKHGRNIVEYGHDEKAITPKIRPVRPEDYDTWRLLWDDYNAFYERTGPTALPEEVTQTTWRRFFDASEPVHCIVAERDGKLLGICHYIFHRSTIMIGPICYLQDLFTSESARGQGIGRALIESVYERAKEQGCKSVYWLTHTTNTPARTLYDKVAKNFGFIEYAQNV
jgi:GNAT superfamily N-acetyltransferase